MPYNYKTELQKYRKYYQSLEPAFTKPSSRAYTTVIFSFLVVSLFGWYAIRPTIQTILYLRREIADKTELNKEMEDKIAALIEAQAFYQEIEPLVPLVDQALPPQPDAVPLVIQLQNLASASGIAIKGLQLPTVPLIAQNIDSTGKPVTKSQEPVVVFTLLLQGTYDTLHTFLTGIETMRRIVSIDSITITRIQQATIISSQSATLQGNNILQLALQLRTFYLTQ